MPSRIGSLAFASLSFALWAATPLAAQKQARAETSAAATDLKSCLAFVFMAQEAHHREHGEFGDDFNKLHLLKPDACVGAKIQILNSSKDAWQAKGTAPGAGTWTMDHASNLRQIK